MVHFYCIIINVKKHNCIGNLLLGITGIIGSYRKDPCSLMHYLYSLAFIEIYGTMRNPMLLRDEKSQVHYSRMCLDISYCQG